MILLAEWVGVPEDGLRPAARNAGLQCLAAEVRLTGEMHGERQFLGTIS